MKKIKIVFLSLIVCAMLCMTHNAYAALPNQTDLIRIHTSTMDYTITNTTTIDQIIQKFGAPKITTDSCFGGHAYTFYTDSNYSNYLYIETLAGDNGIISFGTVTPGYEVYNSGYDEAYPYQANWPLCGLVFNNGTESKVKGGIYYNWNKYINRNANATIELFKSTYYSNPSYYQRCISEHAVAMYNAICAANGYTCNIEFNEEIHYINEQMMQNGSHILNYANSLGKQPYRTVIGTRWEFNDLSSSNNYYLLSPGIYANLYYTEPLNNRDMPERFKYGVFDYDINTGRASAYVVGDNIFTIWDSVSLTATEQARLNSARQYYSNAMSLFNSNSGSIYKNQPVSNVAESLYAGELKANMKNAIIAYYNAIRAGQGLSIVTANAAAFTQAQAMAVLQSYRWHEEGLQITHSPAKPDGVSTDFYRTAIGYGQVSLAENIAMANNLEPSTYAMMKYIRQFMDDSSETPFRLGHRTSLLIPSNSNIGYGIAKSIGVMEIGHDQANAQGIEMVAWPSANGVTLLETLDNNYFRWSAKFYQNYKVTENTNVEVRCIQTGETWNWDTTQTGNGYRYFKRVTNAETELINMVIFGDETLVPQPGFVYEITIKNLTNTNTNKTATYSYRAVFDYADTSNYGTQLNSITIDTKDLIGVSGKTKTYYAPIGEEIDLDAIIDEGVLNKKITWNSSDNNAPIKQNGTIQIPSNYTDGKSIKITVTHDLSGKSDSITLYTYTKKGKVTITPAGPVEMPINPNTEQEFKVTKIGNNYSGNVEWKIIDEQSPNVYLDLTDDKIKDYISVRLANSNKSAFVKITGVSSTGNKYKLVAIATTQQGVYEGEVEISIHNPVESVRITSKLGVAYYVSTSTNSQSEDGTSYYAIISLSDLRNKTNSNIVEFKAEALPKDDTLGNETDWEVIQGEDVISLQDNDGTVAVNNYGYAILRATNVASGVYSDMALYIQEPLQSISIVGSSSEITYDDENPTDQITLTRTPQNNYTPIKYKSSNTNIASVDNNGLVPFKGKAGKVTITATSNNYIEGGTAKTATFEYTVTIPVKELNFKYEFREVNVGEYTQNTASPTPAVTGASSHITYTSSDTSIATVSSSGSVYGEKPGVATITATMDKEYTGGKDVTASYQVYVLNHIYTGKVNGVLNMYDIGDDEEFNVSVSPKHSGWPTTDTYDVEWSSSNEDVATVDPITGIVTPVGIGNTRISAKITPKYMIGENEYTMAPITKSATVYVSKIKITLNTSNIVVNIGSSIMCTAQVTPQVPAFKDNITYSVNDESIATIDQNGKLIGKKAGKVIVTATVDPKFNNGKVASDSKEVTVVKHAQSAEISGPSTINTGDGDQKYDIKITPLDHTDEINVAWESLNPNVATINPQTGVVTPIAQGKVIIKATVIASYTGKNGKVTSLNTTVTKTIDVKYTEKPKYTKGDLDRNNVVDANDASVALELYKAQNATREDVLIGDMDENNLIDANDASLILEYFKTHQ